MTEPIKIIIRGTNTEGTDAPTVEDLLNQIQDFVSVLRGVEGAIADGAKNEIVWRVTDASKNSPLTFEVTPFSKSHAVNVDTRAQAVINATSLGFQSLAQGTDRPMYFSDALIAKTEKIFERVANDLSATTVDLAGYHEAPDIQVDKVAANIALKNVREIRNPATIPYRELGSVEGFISKVELDGHKRPIVWMRHRIDGQMVKCITKGAALDRIGHYEVAEVLKGMRIQVFGVIYYKDIDKIDHVDVDGIHVFDADDQLPSIRDIVDSNFTGGVEASKYLRGLREDG